MLFEYLKYPFFKMALSIYYKVYYMCEVLQEVKAIFKEIIELITLIIIAQVTLDYFNLIHYIKQ